MRRPAAGLVRSRPWSPLCRETRAPAAGMPPTPRLRFVRSPMRRHVLAAGCALSIASLVPVAATADVVAVKSAELRVEEGDLLLSAEFDFALTPTLEEALQRGIPLYFMVEFELLNKRWYWLDDKVAQWSITYRVSYNALTRQYRIASGPLGQAFESLDEVERFIGRVASRPVGRADALSRDVRYEAAVRLRLDVNQLPKPFQVNALASREWQLASEWYRWNFSP